MSLFLDEKTKEEKFKKYCHENNCDNTPFRLAAYLAGWNECEKHVRESAHIGFDEWYSKEYGTAWDVWQAAKASSLVEIEQLKAENERLKLHDIPGYQEGIEELKEESAKKDEMIKFLRSRHEQISSEIDKIKILSLETQIKERDEALIDLVSAMETTWPGEQGVAVELFHIAFLDKHQSLINQIKEGGK